MSTARRRRGNKPDAYPKEQHHEILFGRHAVEAALRNPDRRPISLHLTRNGLREIEDIKLPCPAQEAKPEELQRMIGHDEVHQGMLLQTESLPVFDENDLFQHAQADAFRAVMLDQVTDPRNVGAIMRSAVAFGIHHLILQSRNSPRLDGVTAKTASGAREKLSVYNVTNLSRCLDQASDQNITSIGLDGHADMMIDDSGLKSAKIIVMGAEGKGLRRLVADHCSQLASIPIEGMESLNVSNAAAVTFYAWTR